MLEALIFGANGAITSQVQQMCSALRNVCVYRGMDRYPQVHEAIRLLNGYAPHLVFVDFDDIDTGLALEGVVRSTHPSTAVLAVSSRPRPAIQIGSQMVEPIVVPCGLEEFREAVQEAVRSRGDDKSAPVFTFLPAKAGSGATTTALFVATILSKLASKRVLVLECDLHAGPISMLFNVQPSRSIVDALEESDRLTDQTWKQQVVTVNGIDVLSSLGPRGVRTVTPWAYQRLLTFVRSRYDLIVADLPEVVNDATEVVARSAQSIFIVTSPSIPSLYLAARRRDELEKRGVGAGKIKMVINRKTRGDLVEPPGVYFRKADQVAAIPVDESLVDASAFTLEGVKTETIVECARIAELCGDVELVRKQSGFKSALPGWLRGSGRTPELVSQAALR
jgi:MinD-like ATPase involved in chromosome partitioning or flagellar assembly